MFPFLNNIVKLLIKKINMTGQLVISSKLKLGFIIFSVCMVGNCSGDTFRHPVESLSESELVVFNKFSECLLHIINFRMYEINISFLIQPVVLLSYDSMPGTIIFPNKLLQYEKEFLTKWYSQRNITIPDDIQRIIRKGWIYSEQLFQDSFRLASKRTYCDLIAYVHPPNDEMSRNLYHFVNWNKHSVLKEPFWMNSRER